MNSKPGTVEIDRKMYENGIAGGGLMDDLRDIYNNGAYLENNETWHAQDSPWKATQIARILDNNGITPHTVCEVGCGAGEILRQLSLKYEGANFTGYELSPQAFELCKQRENDRTKYLLGNVLESDAFFDCLLCIDVFEHVEDYMGFIRALKAKATYKVFHIPLDISILAVLRATFLKDRTTIGHLHYFTRETALATVIDCDYEIVDSFYTTAFLELPQKTLKAKIVRFPRQLMFRISQHLAVRILGGCSLMVLAR